MHVVVHGVVRVLETLASFGVQVVNQGPELIVEQGVPQLIMRKHLIVSHLCGSIGISFLVLCNLKIVEIPRFFVL